MTQAPKPRMEREGDRVPTPQPPPPTKPPQSSYPASDQQKKVFGVHGTSYQDNPIGRAWARMFDKDVVFGPAISQVEKSKDSEIERQYFTGGWASRSLSPDNVNLTVQFFDARGLVGEESGL